MGKTLFVCVLMEDEDDKKVVGDKANDQRCKEGLVFMDHEVGG